ncbi:MAG: hypothetical protein PHH13_01945 [Candidatus Peribacteraceae bacterium]|nr:hypothetical protein [Candidatus Peribacteraceae bacterium]
MNSIRGLSIVPHEGEGPVKSAVRIDPSQLESLQQLTATQIMALAVSGGAYEDNSDEEAGDDCYAIQVGDQPVQFLEDDGVVALVRELCGEGGDE